MKPRVFIGSSKEGKALADAIQVNLDHDADCNVWPQSVFDVGSSTLDSLMQAVCDHDFAIFVLSADDELISRGRHFKVPRGNLLFEAGMFLSRYGKGRVFLVTPRDVKDYQLPSDLNGITMADYESSRLNYSSERATLGAACTKILEVIKAVPNNKDVLFVEASHLPGEAKYRFPSKLSMDITNKSGYALVLKQVHFRYHPDMKPSPKAPFLGSPSDNRIKLSFRGNGSMHDLDSDFIRPGERTNTYAGIDPSMSIDEINKAISAKHVGELHLECYWIEEHPRLQHCVFSI